MGAKAVGTFANVCPPDVLDSAWATAVNSFSLVRTDNYVLNGSTRLQDEDCLRLPSLGLTLAFAITALPVVAFHSTVKCTGDYRGSRKRNVAARGRKSRRKASWGT